MESNFDRRLAPSPGGLIDADVILTLGQLSEAVRDWMREKGLTPKGVTRLSVQFCVVPGETTARVKFYSETVKEIEK